MNKEHNYSLNIKWTGNTGTGTSDYRAYHRDFTLSAEGKPELYCSSDPAFLGDGKKYNPEDMLVAALSSCHMLWYLHLCADAGIVVLSYSDNATGIMTEVKGGRSAFTEVVLHPRVKISGEKHKERALSLHDEAKNFCFIANSINFTIRHEPVIES
jgi:organic hydroperoxide reductase OsmC/OhrA